MKTNWLIVVLLLVGVILYFTFNYNSTNTDANTNKVQIDSLNGVIANLKKYQATQDSLIFVYKGEVKVLDHKIDSTEQNLKNLRIYYGNKIRNASRYTPTQLDSFFTKRYEQDSIKK